MSQPASPVNSRKNSETIDFLRFALAVLVIWSHSYALLVGGDHTEPLFRWTGGQITWGGFAVDAFFILSGYLITHSWLHSRGVGDYLKKRVLRIYPGFAVAVAVGVLVFAPFSTDGTLVIEPLRWFTGTLSLRGYEPQGIFPDVPFQGVLNGSLWSISFEFWCYIGVILLGLSKILTRRGLMMGLLLGSIAVSVVFITLGLKMGGMFGVVFGNPSDWARLLPYYLVGCTFYLFRDRVPFTWPLAAVSAALLVVGGALAPWGVALTFPIALAYLLLFVARLPLPMLEGFTKYGDFSYGIYLYAFPIQQLLVRHVDGLTPLPFFALSTVSTLLFAILSWHFVEKPCLKLKTRRVHVDNPQAEPLPAAPRPEN